MNKNITWKQSVLLAVVLYSINLLIGDLLPEGLSTAIEVGSYFALVFSVVIFVKDQFMLIFNTLQDKTC